MESQAKYAVSVDPLIAKIEWFHPPTLPEVVASIKSVLDSPIFHPDLALMVVDHGTEFSLGEHELRESAPQIASCVGRFKACAVVVSREQHYVMVRKLSAHLLPSGVTLGAFRDEVAAGVWLLGQ